MDIEKNMDRATQIVVAFASHNQVEANRLPEIVYSVFSAFDQISSGSSFTTTNTSLEPALKPAVPIEQSITDDYIVCLEDGKKLKMLKRYIRTNYNLSPEEYKRRWGLDADYPLVAPNYSKVRSKFAKEKGLGKRTTDI